MNPHYKKRESSAQSCNLIRLQKLPLLIVLELLARKQCRIYPPDTLHSSTTPTIYSVYLKEMLMGQVAAGIEFKDEDVIHSSLSPAICVDTQEKEEFYQEKATSIDSHQWPHIWSIYKSHTWQTQKWNDLNDSTSHVTKQSCAPLLYAGSQMFGRTPWKQGMLICACIFQQVENFLPSLSEDLGVFWGKFTLQLV